MLRYATKSKTISHDMLQRTRAKRGSSFPVVNQEQRALNSNSVTSPSLRPFAFDPRRKDFLFAPKGNKNQKVDYTLPGQIIVGLLVQAGTGCCDNNTKIRPVSRPKTRATLPAAATNPLICGPAHSESPTQKSEAQQPKNRLRFARAIVKKTHDAAVAANVCGEGGWGSVRKGNDARGSTPRGVAYPATKMNTTSSYHRLPLSQRLDGHPALHLHKQRRSDGTWFQLRTTRPCPKYVEYVLGTNCNATPRALPKSRQKLKLLISHFKGHVANATSKHVTPDRRPG